MGHQSCNHIVSGLKFSTTAVPKRISIQTTVTILRDRYLHHALGHLSKKSAEKLDVGAVAETKRRAKRCGWAFNGAVERSVEA